MNNAFVIKLTTFDSIEGYTSKKILPVIFSSLEDVDKVIIHLKRLNSYVSLYHKGDRFYRIPNDFRDMPIIKESELEKEEWYVPYKIAFDYEYRMLEVSIDDPYFKRLAEIKQEAKKELDNSFKRQMSLSLEYFKIGDVAVSNEWDLFNVSLQEIEIIEINSEEKKKEIENNINDLSSKVVFGTNFDLPLLNVIYP